MSIAYDSQTCGCIPSRGVRCSVHQPVQQLGYYVSSSTPMTCAVCAMDHPAGGMTMWGVTQVGALWVCGGHVRRALEFVGTPTEWSPPRVVAHPGRCSGQPTVGESRIPAEMVAEVMWQHGMGEAESQWEPIVDRYGVLAACWYMTRYGSRTWRKRWAEWLQTAEPELWHVTQDRWDSCPDPPSLTGG